MAAPAPRAAMAADQAAVPARFAAGQPARQADGSLWVPAIPGQRLSQSWLAVSPLGGDTPAMPTAVDGPATSPPAPGHPVAAAPYPLGLMWLSAEARAAQRKQLRALLDRLSDVPGRAGSATAADDAATPEPAADPPTARAVLRRELASLPITGRVPLPAHDPQWLQANPAYDPVLQAGDEWWLPVQPGIVRVWVGVTQRCDLPFAPGWTAAAYLARCLAGQSGHPSDHAYIVQPDGRIAEVGLAAWNAARQALPAPGAWLWVPQPSLGIGTEGDRAVAHWLATQGPAGAEWPPRSHAWTPDAERGVSPQAVAAPSELLVVPSLADGPLRLDRPPGAPRDLPLLAGDWGITGLLQTPSARTRPAGSFGLSVSRAPPYTRVNLLLSPFERVELALRYTNMSYLLYGPAIAGDQSNKDKSSEIKVRLWDESAWAPALALGLRDPGGTGLFAGEYLVASKRWGDLDVSMGLGWGYLGARANLRNPLARLSTRFAQRTLERTATGGTANLSSLFTGPTALFGGVQWQTPWDHVVARVEWDGNDYQHEPQQYALPARSGVNAGLTWRWGDAELGLAWQRGNQWAFSLAWVGQLQRLSQPKTALPRLPAPDDAPVIFVPRGVVASQATSDAKPPGPAPDAAADAQEDSRQTAALLQSLSEHSGWHATRLVREPERWTIYFDHAGGALLRERIERIWAVLNREAPPEVRLLAMELASRQLPLVRHEVDRQGWVDARTRYIARHQRSEGAPEEGQGAGTAPQVDQARMPVPDETPRLALGVNPGFRQHLGGPDGYLYALSARGFGQLRAWPGAWLQGTVDLRLLDNYEGFNYTAPSNLPRVRTWLREYVTSRRLTLANLQFNQVARLSPNLYAMAYAGWLEPMFAGVGAELLWRPLNSPWAVGLDLNWVRQRDYEQALGLLDYRVQTGHLTVRWDTGWQGVVLSAAAGQYLAGDRGVTVDVSRTFANGTRMGLWATKTNVSAEQFGEGSFDKGLYLSVPFDLLLGRWSSSALTVAWQPLVRDGGARLAKGASLWGLTELRDAQALELRSVLDLDSSDLVPAEPASEAEPQR
jgi:hypothetical protein